MPVLRVYRRDLTSSGRDFEQVSEVHVAVVAGQWVRTSRSVDHDTDGKQKSADIIYKGREKLGIWERSTVDTRVARQQSACWL